jgi:molybdenum cofactor cytidylyltransferase
MIPSAFIAATETALRLRTKFPGICSDAGMASGVALGSAMATGGNAKMTLRPTAVIPRESMDVFNTSGRLLRMNSPRHHTLAVLLSAGAGSRFLGPQHKLRAIFNGKTLFIHSLEQMLAASLDGALVVTGAVELGDLVADTPTVHNTNWATGQRSSVLTALSYARQHGYTALVVGLADQPGITSEAWRLVADADSPIAVATYNGVRGNPVRLHESVWSLFETLDSEPDSGARTLMHLHPELVMEVACKGNPADIDTTEDLTTWT